MPSRIKFTRSASTVVSRLPDLPEYSPLRGAGANLWATAILSELGAPTNSTNIGYMVGWFAMEGGGGKNNPLNTKKVTNASTGSVPGTSGVQNYNSPAAGVRATVQTLQGNFPAIVQSLKAGKGIPSTPTIATELHGWSAGYSAPWTNGYSSITPSNGYSSTTQYVSYGGYRPTTQGGSQQSPSYPNLTAMFENQLNAPRTAPKATDVSLLSQINSALGWVLMSQGAASSAPFLGKVEGFGGIGTLISETIKNLEMIPEMIVRFAEFTTGMILLGVGLYVGITPQQQGTSVMRRGIKNAVESTPLGESMRIRKAVKLGSREGRQEHYRLKSRRSARSQLGESDAAVAITGKRPTKAQSRKYQKEGERKNANLRATAKNKD